MPADAQAALQALIGSLAGAVGSEVAAALTAHLGPGADRMEIVRQDVSGFEHVNLQAALDAYVTGPGRTHELHGVTGGDSSGLLGMTTPPPLEVLLGSASTKFGPVGYVNRTCGPDQTRPCVNKGLYLISNGKAQLALWIYEELLGNLAGQTILQAVSADIADTRDFLAELSRLMVDLNVYRGQVHSLSSDAGGRISVQFLERVPADRDAVILPPGVLESLEEQTIGIGRLRDTLLAAGRHLKRGLLLYGPPGTGKTHTVRYLVSQLPEYTVFYLTGSAMGALRAVGDMLPRVAPALVVLDDVDLIAEDRDRVPGGGMSPRRFLFDLLDLMDGLHEDLDVAFVLTTNRVEAIESAIAARPGRVDLAVEIPVPDRDSLRRLIDLYAVGIDLRLQDIDAVLARLEGVTASFVRELLRRAVLVASRDGADGQRGAQGPGPVVITDAHVHAALDLLLDPRSPLTAALLGRHAPPVTAAAVARTGPGGEWCPLS